MPNRSRAAAPRTWPSTMQVKNAVTPSLGATMMPPRTKSAPAAPPMRTHHGSERSFGVLIGARPSVVHTTTIMARLMTIEQMAAISGLPSLSAICALMAGCMEMIAPSPSAMKR